MEMVKVKTAELIEQALEWAVAMSEGHKPPLLRVLRGNVAMPQEDDPMWCDYMDYSTNWAQGGEIIDRENIELTSFTRHNEHGLPERIHRATVSPEFQFQNYRSRMSRYTCDGPTKLVAAMRCYVTWKLGEEVEVPKELL